MIDDDGDDVRRLDNQSENASTSLPAATSLEAGLASITDEIRDERELVESGVLVPRDEALEEMDDWEEVEKSEV